MPSNAQFTSHGFPLRSGSSPVSEVERRVDLGGMEGESPIPIRHEIQAVWSGLPKKLLVGSWLQFWQIPRESDSVS